MKIHVAEYVKSAPGLKDVPDFGNAPEIVFVGRSNVGKSSFINSLLQRKNLAQTSNTPGKTRYINLYRVELSRREGAREPLIFADLPGYGFAKVSKTEQEKWRRNMEAYLSRREPIRLAVQLIDGRHGLQDSDISMYEWLQFHGRPVLVVLTKTDKISRNEVEKQKAATSRALDCGTRGILAYSSETHAGRDEAWRRLFEAIETSTPAV